MAFWTIGSGDQAQDPKRQYRFVAEFGIGSDCQWMVKNVGKPSVSLSEASHEYLNHTFYYPGRASWNSVSVTLVDPVSPDAGATMMGILDTAGYRPPIDANSLNTVSKKGSIEALGYLRIRQIDAAGEDVEVWALQNAWVKSVTLSGLDYSGDSLSEVTLEIRYDFATLEKHGPSVDGKLSKDQGLWSVQTT
tara:strand:- start:5243 stop:5818 length:576 start_codon:yes stop_codon:yes gene_type:complete